MGAFLIRRTYVFAGRITKKMAVLVIIECIPENLLFFRTFVLNQILYLYIKIATQLTNEGCIYSLEIITAVSIKIRPGNI